MTTAQLTTSSIKDSEIARLRAINAELLSTLEGIKEEAEFKFSHRYCAGFASLIFHRANAAITKAETKL